MRRGMYMKYFFVMAAVLNVSLLQASQVSNRLAPDQMIRLRKEGGNLMRATLPLAEGLGSTIIIEASKDVRVTVARNQPEVEPVRKWSLCDKVCASVMATGAVGIGLLAYYSASISAHDYRVLCIYFFGH